MFDAVPIQLDGLEENKKVFFVSDVHLPLHGGGVPPTTQREDAFLDWLDFVKPQAQALFLLGDIFDFWFEYQYLIPKGAVRFQAKLLEFQRSQIPVYFFLGNHDLWALDYFETVCGVRVFRRPASISICKRSFLVGHGDGADPTRSYAFLRGLYANPLVQSMARLVPADWFYGMVHRYFQKKAPRTPTNGLPSANDRIVRFCKERVEPVFPHNFYIFGHTHVPCIQEIGPASLYCNTGDFISNRTYACFDGTALELLAF